MNHSKKREAATTANPQRAVAVETTAAAYELPPAAKAVLQRSYGKTRESAVKSLGSAAEQVAVLDRNGRILAVNEPWRDRAGQIDPFLEQATIGADFIEVCRDASISSERARSVLTGVRSVLARRSESFAMESAADAPNEHIFLRTQVTRFSYADAAALITQTLVSESKKMEDSSLAGRLLKAQEEERLRISREIHDDVNGRIAAIAFAIRQLATQNPILRESLVFGLDQILDKTEDLAQTVRNLSHQLHSPALKHAGIRAGLNALCREFRANTGIAVELAADEGLEHIPDEVALCLFRIAQEALNNVAKHSRAKAGNIRLERAANEIVLTVRDSGRGFDAASVSKEGLGLVSMRERVRLVGGSIQIQSARGSGAQVQVRVPANFTGKSA